MRLRFVRLDKLINKALNYDLNSIQERPQQTATTAPEHIPQNNYLLTKCGLSFTKIKCFKTSIQQAHKAEYF